MRSTFKIRITMSKAYRTVTRTCNFHILLFSPILFGNIKRHAQLQELNLLTIEILFTLLKFLLLKLFYGKLTIFVLAYSSKIRFTALIIL